MKIIYYLTKLLSNIFQRIYYQFDYIGLENVPVGKPVVFAPNHVNAFMDPILIGMTVRQEVRFFARGDVFKGAFAKWILNELHISPVYRIQEGYSEVKKNDKTFEECRQLLINNKTILMFPEGICIQERRLRPLKKGLARIVFQTAASVDFNKDILVVPIGVNYSSAKNFRSKAVIHFGKPVSTLPFQEAFLNDNVRAINEFTKVLEDKMKHQLVIINNRENEHLVAALEEMYQKEWIKLRSGDPVDLKEQYKTSQQIAEMVNELDKIQPEMVISLRTHTSAYIKKLKQFGLRDHLLDEAAINKMNFGTFLLETILIYFGLPIYGIALVLNFPPYYLAKKYSDDNIKNIEFYASVCSNLAMILWLVYYLIQLIAIAVTFHSWSLLAFYSFIVPLLGLFAIKYYSVKQKIFGRWRLLRLVRKNQPVVSELVHTRSLIFQQIAVAKKAVNF